jgi:hypothetical protein
MISRIERLRKASRAPSAATVLVLAVALLGATRGFVRAADAEGGWPQFGRTPQHTGLSSAAAQPLESIRADAVYDPFVDAMKNESDGDLLAHYAAPLSDDTGVYMAFKSGTWTGFGNWGSITWSVKKLAWVGSALEVVWSFDSDWIPEPLSLAGWEPVFQPALSGDDVWIPGLGGTVFRVARETGALRARINPFATIDGGTYVAGGLAVAPDGAIVYDVLQPPAAFDAQGWLVRVAPDGTASKVDFATLVPQAPAATDACQVSFPSSQRPWPPSPGAVAPTVPCGPQRPGINVVPAIAPDGTIYTMSRADNADRYAYLVAVHPDLTPAWAASLRGFLNDGCGVLLHDDDSGLGCRAGANTGVDPSTNDRPAGRVNDAGSASPVVLPDGRILYGAFTSYNFYRGHLFEFDATGAVLATYDFGWDVTPAVWPHDGTYSILLKDNHYASPDGTDFYDVTLLDAGLTPVWSFRSTNTESCVRGPGGAVTCVDDHPDGFEWCVNQPAIDVAGHIFLNSEDGTLYAFDASGNVAGSLFLDTALGAAYTPVAIGPDGIVWAQNDGHLFAVGAAWSPSPRGGVERPAGAEPPPRRVVR